MMPDHVTSLIKTAKNAELKALLSENPELALGQTEQGVSFLLFAAYCRNTTAVNMIRKIKKSITIHEASAIGDIREVANLIDANADLLDSESSDGFGPLGLACFFGHTDLVKLLVEKGANVNQASNNDFQVTPLHSASAIGNVGISRILLDNGANVNAKQMSGVTPLQSAAHNGSVDLVKLFITHGADIVATTNEGKTALMFAEESGYHEVVSILNEIAS